jgi:hypothetical protein
MGRYKIQDDAMLKLWSGTDSATTIAHQYGMSREYVLRRARDLGLYVYTQQASKVNTDRLREIWHGPMTVAAIAADLSVSQSAVHASVRKLGLRHKGSNPPQPAPPKPQVEVAAPVTRQSQLFATQGKYAALAAWGAQYGFTAKQAVAAWHRRWQV